MAIRSHPNMIENLTFPNLELNLSRKKAITGSVIPSKSLDPVIISPVTATRIPKLEFPIYVAPFISR